MLRRSLHFCSTDAIFYLRAKPVHKFILLNYDVTHKVRPNTCPWFCVSTTTICCSVTPLTDDMSALSQVIDGTLEGSLKSDWTQFERSWLQHKAITDTAPAPTYVDMDGLLLHTRQIITSEDQKQPAEIHFQWQMPERLTGYGWTTVNSMDSLQLLLEREQKRKWYST